MIHERWTELLHGEIDGVNTPAENAELAAQAAADPAIARSREELRELVRKLDQVPAVEPPETLRHDILRAIPVTSGTGYWGLVRASLFGRPALVFAGGAAAVLILAFLGRDFMRPVTQIAPTDSLTGAMTPGPQASSPSATARLDEDPQSGPSDLAGSLTLARTPAGVTLRLDVVSATQVQVELTYDPESLVLLEPATATPGSLRLQGGDGHALPGEVVFQEIVENVEKTVHFEISRPQMPPRRGTLKLGMTQ